MKYGGVLLVLSAVLAIGLIVWRETPSPEPAAAPAVVAVEASRSEVTNVSSTSRAQPDTSASLPARRKVPATTPSNNEPPPVPEYDLDQAMTMMRQSAEQGDPRQPDIAPPIVITPPSNATESPDLEASAERETRQDRAAVAAYAQILKQLPELRARVAQAQADKSRTPADYQEAQEALDQLERMRERLAREHPELLP